MGLVTRALGGCVAIACAASLSGAAALPVVDRTLSSADVASGQRLGLGNVPPEQQSPDHDVPVSVTEVEPVSVDLSGLSVRATNRRVAAGDLGIPSMVLEAYQAAADAVAADDPGCGLRWEVLAGIGKIESNHASGGQLNSDGVTVPRIIGPVLNGAGPVAAISDSDDGQWDGDGVWDRAVGPMQFIPGTWRGFGVDGDGDGVADPHNIWDSTLSAGRYLCAGGGDLSSDVGLRAALYRYNRSWTYGDNVLSWIDAYSDGNAVPSPGRGPGTDDAAREADPEPKLKPKEPVLAPPPDDDPEEEDTDPDLVAVPELVGMTQSGAVAALAELGLVPVVTEQETADEAEVGLVLSQTPEALTEVAPGAEVTVTVGVAPPPPELLAVPELVGMVLADAEAALAALGLVPVVTEQETADEAEVGRVLSQVPEALTEVAPDAEVTLTVGVAPEPEPVAVPDLVGETRVDAEAALAELGLVPVVTEQETADEAEVGLVLSQTPEALTEVAPGGEVTLTVGVAPPPPELVAVPELVGMVLADAEAALAELGLVVVVVEQVVEDEAQVGQVVRQDPEAATELAPGAEVTVTVGVAPVAVPELVGMALAEADAELTELGFVVVVVEQVVEDEAQVGQVVGQEPEAATELAPGAEVTVTVGVAP